MRKQNGTKNYCMHAQLGRFLDKRYKRPKNSTATFKETREKAGYCSCPLHIPPAGEGDKIPKPLPSQIEGHTLSSYKKQTHTPLEELASKGIFCLFLFLSAAAVAPTKLCLNFLSCLQSTSIDWRNSRLLVNNNITHPTVYQENHNSKGMAVN